MKRLQRIVLSGVLLVAAACGSSSGDGGDPGDADGDGDGDGAMIDAAPGAPDADPAAPDAGPAAPDAGPGGADAGPMPPPPAGRSIVVGAGKLSRGTLSLEVELGAVGPIKASGGTLDLSSGAGVAP